MTLEYSYFQWMVLFSPRLQNDSKTKPGQLGQSDSTVCFLSYNRQPILYLKQPHTDRHAERGFDSLVRVVMIQVLEAIKEETWQIRLHENNNFLHEKQHHQRRQMANDEAGNYLEHKSQTKGKFP